MAPRLLASSLLRGTILSYQQYELENGSWVHRHPLYAQPDGIKAYTNLANVYFLAYQSDPRRHPEYLEKAERDFKISLALDPKFKQSKDNLDIVYRLARSEGRLRRVSPPEQPPRPGEPLFTGYEVAPKKG